MKKFLLTCTAIAGLTLASKAQEITGFQQGSIIVEGNLGFNNLDNKNSEVKGSSFGFTPKVGYFINEKFALGLGLNFTNETLDMYSSSVDTKNSNNSFGVGVFGRYYFLELGERFKTYTELNVDYNSGRDKKTVAGTTTKDPKTNVFGINAGIGANYFLTDKIAINFGFANVIGYNSAKVDVDGAKATNEFGLNINQFNNFFDAAQFGLTFKF